MPARLRLTLVVATACLVLGLAAVVLLGGPGGEAAVGVDPTGFHGAVKPPTARAPDFALHDQDGRPVTMHEYRGSAVVVTFLYSTCQDTCPLTAQQIRGGLDQLGRKVPVLAISVDPVGDTPAHVRRFLVREQLVGRMRYLVGTHSELEPIWHGYGVQPQGRGYEHTAATVIVDAAGRQRVGYLSDQLTPEGLAADLRKLGAGARATS